MTRLIDAEALKSDFQDRLRKAKNWKENALNKGDDELVIRAEATIDFICEVIMTIDNAPTVVAENATTERPHGEWIEKIYTEKLGHGYLTHHDIVCSVCGDSGEDDEGIPQNYKFCPNCGADMRGKE